MSSLPQRDASVRGRGPLLLELVDFDRDFGNWLQGSVRGTRVRTYKRQKASLGLTSPSRRALVLVDLKKPAGSRDRSEVLHYRDTLELLTRHLSGARPLCIASWLDRSNMQDRVLAELIENVGATLISGKGYREQLVKMLLTITRRDPSLVMTDAFISDEGLNVTFADGKRAFVDFAALKRLTEHTDIRWNRVRIAPSRDHIAVELLDDKDVPVPSDILRDYIVDAGSKQRAENSVLRTTTAGTLGKRLKTLREAKKLTQEILAEKARTSRWTIMRLEKGTLLPKIAVLERIAHALGTNLLSFLPS